MANKLFESWNTAATMWIWIFPFAFLMFFFSLKIVRYSSYLLSSTKLSGSFIGVALVSIVTSMPELITQIIQGADGKPSVGISNILGANAITVLTVGIVWLFMFRQLIKNKITKDSVILVILTFLITVITTVLLYFGKDIKIGNAAGFSIGIIPIFLLVYYLGVGVYLYYHGKKYKNTSDPSYIKHETTLSLFKIISLFIMCALFLIICAIFLNWTVDASSSIYSIDPKSGGGLILSLVTTLPEITAFIAFVKHGYISAGIASILGANILNLSLLFLTDITYIGGPIFIEQAHHNIWLIGAMISLMLLLFYFIIIINMRKIKSKTIILSLPILIIVTYILGWSFLIFYF